jgi:prepilin-type N-terminal cleavage/methylation domain-containing protein
MGQLNTKGQEKTGQGQRNSILVNSKRKGFTLLELIITIVMLMVFIVIPITVIVLCVKGCNKVQETGLKNIGTQIWNGTNAVPPAIANGEPSKTAGTISVK